MHIIHVIAGLNDGGAEAVLFRLCCNDYNNQHSVISLMNKGKYGSLLVERGIEVHCLNMPQGRVTLSGLRELYRLLKKNRPDVVQTWMYHADLIGGVVARIVGIKNIFWNIRHTTLEKGFTKKSTIYTAKFCAILSNLIPKKIVCCANKSAEVHKSLGYNKNKIKIIGNGYDLNNLSISKQSSSMIKDEFSLHNVSNILGMVGRYNPLKDHSNLLTALSLIKEEVPNFKCLLVGRFLDSQNKQLVNEINNLNLQEHVLLLGQRTDIPAIMNALDIHILSSYSEAFPNVLAEAMACGTPCVTTNVGDAALIVGETGWIVPPQDSLALSDAIILALNEKNTEEWEKRQLAVQQRIVEKFSIDKMISDYHEVWSF